MPEGPEPPDRSKEAQVCPFCGGRFPGHTECPEHELSLVSLDVSSLEAAAGGHPGEVFGDARLARWGVVLGAALVLIAFAAPFARSSKTEASALFMAIDGAKNLWLIPCAALAQLWILWSRRTQPLLRTARAAVFGLAVGGTLPLGYTTWRISRVAEATGDAVAWSWGLWSMLVGFVVSAAFAWRLGGPR